MRKAICSTVLFFLFLPLITHGVKRTDFDQNFYIAKQHLSQRRIKKAMPYLIYLQKAHPENDNIKYLLGLCYAEAEIVNPKAIKLLREASKRTSLQYDPNDLAEKRVPVYVYYYLCIAYAQNKQCDEAEKARLKFLEIYPHKDRYYIDESKEWITSCYDMTIKPEIKELPTFPDFKPFVSEASDSGEGFVKSKIEDSLELESIKEENSPPQILTKAKHYSTSYPLYGIQLGAYNDVIPVSRFKSLKNVDAFMDHDGLIRYVIGHFSLRSQAASLHKIIQNKGYEDAFIVNVNDAKKYREEVVSINNVNIRANQNKKVEFRIQVGAFKEELTKSSAQLYMKIEGIEEVNDQNFTYLTVGDFEFYIEAKAYLQGISDVGIKDAFVVAVSDGQKVPLKDVIGVNELKQNEELNY